MFFSFFFLSALLPVLHHKAKKGPPRQAKYAIHCINAIFSSKETQFAQIFEVKMKILVSFDLSFIVHICKIKRDSGNSYGKLVIPNLQKVFSPSLAPFDLISLM